MYKSYVMFHTCRNVWMYGRGKKKGRNKEIYGAKIKYSKDNNIKIWKTERQRHLGFKSKGLLVLFSRENKPWMI